MDLGQFQRTYFEECSELLGEIEERLLAISAGDVDEESLHALFRAVHSIKGGAGAFGFDQLVAYAHTFETLLDGMRDGRVPLSSEAANVLIDARDILEQLVHAARSNAELPADYGHEVSRKLEALTRGDSADAVGSTPTASAGKQAVEGVDFGLFDDEPEPSGSAANGKQAVEGVDFGLFTDEPEDFSAASGNRESGRQGARGQFKISFAPAPDMFRKANEPLLLIRELLTLGLLRVQCHTEDVPPLDRIDPEGAYLNWRMEITTDASADELREVFEFVEDDCHLKIEPVFQAGGDDLFIDESGAWGLWKRPEDRDAPEQLETPVQHQAPVASPQMPEKSPASPPAEAGKDGLAVKQARPAGKVQASQQQRSQTTIRVDLDKIDRLVNMVGEIVITQAMLNEQVLRASVEQPTSLLQGVEELSQHTRELQEAVMAIRAQPVKSVFARMARLIHDVSPTLGKEVKLTISGEATEVDKTVIEQLSDPLTHMIRNSIDHGIEAPDVREAAGKPRQGTIHLSAGQRGGRIVIEVADDGAGLNRERIRKKAEEKGLVQPGVDLSNDQIDNIIFMPGFSTADKVSDISGRGVGMDVVRRNIQNLGGRISVTGNPGKGTRFILTLPLTLAVLDGMIVRVGEETYVLPLSSIIETIRPSRKDIHQLVNNSEMLAMRGDFIPVIYLSRIFDVKGATADSSRGLVVLVDVEGGNRVGLVIDELMGQQQVVIKSLENNYRRLEGISGATILGDGRVSLILDPASIAAMWEDGRGAAPTPRDEKTARKALPAPDPAR